MQCPRIKTHGAPELRKYPTLLEFGCMCLAAAAVVSVGVMALRAGLNVDFLKKSGLNLSEG